MSNDNTKKWVEAATILAGDPAALVTCPVCGKDKLKVTDVRAGDVVERALKCPSCGAVNYMRMVRPLPPGSD